MNIKNIVVAAAFATTLGAASSVSAAVIDFAVNPAISTAEVDCQVWTCDLSANVVVDTEIFSLGVDESYTFDFFTLDAGSGFFGSSGGDFDVEASLAFSAPLAASVFGSGEGDYLTLFGLVSGGSLSWNNLPATYEWGGGNSVTVAFSDGFTVVPGGSATVQATVTVNSIAPVPLPASALLLLGGFGAFGAFRRKQRKAA